MSGEIRTEVDATVVILAAGQSSRMGRAKLALELNHSPLLNIACAKALDISTDVIVVLGAYDTPYRQLLTQHPSIHILHNEQWRQGIGSSVALACQYLMSSQSQCALFLLADQPLISSHHIDNLLQLSQTHDLCLSRYSDGHLGVPAVVQRSLFAKACSLQRQGLKVLKGEAKSLGSVVLAEEEARDIDTPVQARALGIRL